MIQDAGRRSSRTKRLGIAAALALVLAACAPRVEPAGPVIAEPRLEPARIVAADGAILPLRRWMPASPPRAAIVALHGFNDYSKAFEGPAGRLTAHRVAVYAYDQRGFGNAPNRRIWPGTTTLVEDARTALALVKRAHPGIPVYLLGLSMGGAVGLLATTGPASGPGNMAGPNAGGATAEGVILVGPAVWGRRHMGVIPRAALWLFARLVPWFPLTGEGIGIKPSDNIEMLRALGRDPLVIKQTRLDAIHGLVDLMDAALEAGGRVATPTLILVGTKDELIPRRPTLDLLARLPADAPVRAAFYPNGYHMLLRDLDAARVLDDIVAWIDDPAAALPSGADREAERYRAGADR